MIHIIERMPSAKLDISALRKSQSKQIRQKIVSEKLCKYFAQQRQYCLSDSSSHFFCENACEVTLSLHAHEEIMHIIQVGQLNCVHTLT